jgi:coniferyl-aldehyde dehydrogenase
LDTPSIPPAFQTCFDAQREAFAACPQPSHAQRKQDLQMLARMLQENRDALVRAIALDYGHRSEFETLFAEYFGVLDQVTHAIRHLRRWMKPQRRAIDVTMFPGASNWLVPQPLGVVGVIVPWNFPLNLSFCPLISIFAAGNRAMVKMSENSQHLAAQLIEISPRYFPADKLQFFQDGPGLGPAFSSLPFDHLLFTGSSATGRAVMANAARNLTPVTLELGGKSPAIVGPDYPLRKATERILWAKLLNAGQICIAVDHVFVPEDRTQEFVGHCQAIFAKRYPTVDGDDYTAIIDERAYARLEQLLEDARQKGATLINLAEGQAVDRARRKFPPHVVLNVRPDMRIAQQEIFGPILPVWGYTDAAVVVRAIQAQDRPLALYVFSHDKALQTFYIDRVMSGGVAINDCILHQAQHSLPFGGVGASGMGHYHGLEGFQTFSKLRPIFKQGPFSTVQMLFMPPYKHNAMAWLQWLIKLKT